MYWYFIYYFFKYLKLGKQIFIFYKNITYYLFSKYFELSEFETRRFSSCYWCNITIDCIYGFFKYLFDNGDGRKWKNWSRCISYYWRYIHYYNYKVDCLLFFSSIHSTLYEKLLSIFCRFVAMKASGEVEVMRRNRAIIEWCLFVLSSDIKTFFLFEHIYYYCNIDKPTDCNYSTTQLQLLSLIHALISSALYILLVSVGFIKSSRTHQINQLNLSAFVTIVDLLDIIQLKTSLFQLHPDKIAFSFPLLIYIYCSFVSGRK